VHALPFGRPTELEAGFTITCFEPASLWNDAILLVEVAGFRYLNLNDAGVNHRIARHVTPVDLISSTFSPGASGYPLTWQHLTDVEKLSIMERSRQGSLDMLHDAARAYGAHFVLPFASFFSLGHPEHRHYLEMFRKNAPADVVNAFEATQIEVVDLLPGEVWNAANGKRTRLDYDDREHIFNPRRMHDYAVERWDDKIFRAHFPAAGSVGDERVEGYFLRLNETPELAFCEELTFVVRGIASGGEAGTETSFQVAGGRLEPLPVPPLDPNVTIELPLGILERIIADDVSWDEAFIGYWCRLTRSPDVYHAGFWRLLQAPYYRRSAGLEPRTGAAVGPDATIAEVLEAHGDVADRILRRHGLYCLGCAHSPSESLRQGAAKHGLSEVALERLVAELRQAAPEPVAAGARR
jgi:CMP-N-acetylneuraminate monooxygenase